MAEVFNVIESKQHPGNSYVPDEWEFYCLIVRYYLAEIILVPILRPGHSCTPRLSLLSCIIASSMHFVQNSILTCHADIGASCKERFRTALCGW